MGVAHRVTLILLQLRPVHLTAPTSAPYSSDLCTSQLRPCALTEISCDLFPKSGNITKNRGLEKAPSSRKMPSREPKTSLFEAFFCCTNQRFCAEKAFLRAFYSSILMFLPDFSLPENMPKSAPKSSSFSKKGHFVQQ